MKILNFGSLNIDYVYGVEHFVKKGETLASDSLEVFSGGKGLNQSVALARAGVSVHHAGVIGEDGVFLLEVLEKAGADTKQVQVRKDVRTGSAVIQTDRNGDNCIILYGGANRNVTEEYIDEVLGRYGEGDFLILQNEISRLPYLVTQAHRKKMEIVLNPSPVNERLWEVPLEYISYFILNEIEAAQIAGIESEEAEVLLDRLRNKFPEAKVLLTLGEKGSVYRDREHTFYQKAIPVDTIDTTAAGDTYTGYFMAGIIEGRQVHEAARLAAFASSMAVSKKGAAPSIPSMEEVTACMKQHDKERRTANEG